VEILKGKKKRFVSTAENANRRNQRNWFTTVVLSRKKRP
jgi:hypothetical protein